jgi:hypothetical protein
MSPAAGQDKQTVDDETAFQLRLPPGWHKVPGTSLANYESADKKVSLSVDRTPFDKMTPDQFLKMHALMHGKDSPVPLMSEEPTSLSGLPAKKFVYFSKEGGKSTRAWQIFVFARHEEWHLYISGPEEFLRSEDDPHYRDAQAVITSFKFSDATLSRLVSDRWIPASGNETNEPGEREEPVFLIYGALAIVVLVLLAFWTTRRKHARLLLPLAELLDEHEGETQGSFVDEADKVQGHYHGRYVSFVLEEGTRSAPRASFKVALSIRSRVPFMFAVRKKRSTFLGPGLPGDEVMAGDPKLDEKFGFSDVLGGDNFFMRKLGLSIPEQDRDKNRKDFQAWVKRPEIAPALESLIYTQGVTWLSSGSDTDVLLPIGITSPVLVAHLEGYRKKSLEPARVRGILDCLVTLASSLES